MTYRNQRTSTEADALKLAEQWSRESGGEVGVIDAPSQHPSAKGLPYFVQEPPPRTWSERYVAEFRAGVRVTNTGAST